MSPLRQQSRSVTANFYSILYFTLSASREVLFGAAFDSVSSSTGAGLATPENVSSLTRSVAGSARLCRNEARI